MNVEKQPFSNFRPFNWQEVFYYPAAGVDIEPLKRFSNLCDTFFHVNIYMSKEDIIDGILKATQHEQPFLSCTGVVEYSPFHEEVFFPSGFQARASKGFQWLNAHERRLYNKAFLPALNSDERDWLIEFHFIRKDNGRKLRLIYLRGEGLATYMAFSGYGSPKVFCTVQSDVLEYPNELMTCFFEKMGHSPQIWIRGFAELGDIEFHREYLPVHGRDRLFSRRGQDFIGCWSVYCNNRDYLYSAVAQRRFCRAFIKEDTSRKILSIPFRSFDKNSIKQGNIMKLARQYGNDAIFVTTDKIRIQYVFNGIQPPVRTYRHLLGRKPRLDDWQILAEAIRKLSREEKKPVYFTPYMCEDSGERLAEFLSEDHPYPLHAVVYNPLDLIDLREYNPIASPCMPGTTSG